MDTTSKDTADGHLRSTMGFEMFVEDVMTRNVISVLKYDSVVHAAHILSEKNISGLPVVDRENNVIGIITQADILSIVGMRKEHTFKDLLKHILGERLPERKIGDIVADIMASPAVTLPPRANIAEAAQIMDEKKIRRLPVVDDGNKLIGIISRADILKAVLRKLQ
jgi:sulfide:quinone oxidoreductase